VLVAPEREGKLKADLHFVRKLQIGEKTGTFIVVV
jgi:hypothetical protein